jgi:hypothetical protein
MNRLKTNLTMPVFGRCPTKPFACRIGMKITNTNRKVKFCPHVKRKHIRYVMKIMNTAPSKTDTPPRSSKSTVGRLFFLEVSSGSVLSANPDGSDRKIIVTGCRIPDGVVMDVEAGHIYWTNMGNPIKNDGSIERAELDGQNRKTIVTEGS